MNKENVFNGIVAAIGTWFTYIFGAWDTPLAALVGFMLVDYITGMVASYINDMLNSRIGFKGILRKCIILLVLILGVLLDRLLNDGTWVFRTLICYFYIANEGLSIIENVGKCGVNYPPALKDALEQLQERDIHKKQDQ
ncbi:phage holin family protein [Clostridium botulinum]|uniref:phage holin family protein n=1 Tax=Clostridium botulinum TaxID=1491 RepID=UPI0013F04D2A|nr:phage holin family protein [Clostridium botulinum]MBY6950361.1 phage holin family protein [Clostridium botulinum]MCR1138611.1 phage holin family protein [Clostridium botulinum]NEZ80832.1 holin [Clostridium botulinum]NFA16657.1 holin [Clostridium botulinum]NFA54773.1 holin [Clostridium botulinum]